MLYAAAPQLAQRQAQAQMTDISHRKVWTIAWPMVISNISTPLLGLVDTAVIGQLESASYLGAIALGVLLFNFLYLGLGFLRMGTTAFTAQAFGAGDDAEVDAGLGRAVIVGLSLGLVMIAVQLPIAAGAFWLLEGSAQVESLARNYLAIRIWGAPAALTVFVFVGWFIGLQKTKLALALQVWLNAVNIILDVFFVMGLGWDVDGVAYGTLIAEWSTVLVGAALVWRELAVRQGKRPSANWSRMLDVPALRRMLSVNGDIFIRTICLVFAFSWFTAQGAKAGDTILAANYVLMQFIMFASFFLDGFAFAAETLVGSAIGAQKRKQLTDSVLISTRIAGGTAFVLTILFIAFGGFVIDTLTTAPDVRAEARNYLLWAASIPIVAVWCFQLDGIFIGATRGADLRNMMVISLAVYLAFWYALTPVGNHGLWAAFIAFFIARGITLGLRYQALVRESVPASAQAS